MAWKKAPLTLRRLLHPHNLCPVKMNSCYHGLFTERIFVGNCLWFAEYTYWMGSALFSLACTLYLVPSVFIS